jgi:DNA-binding NarL/FixJ family response regulator
MKATNSAGTIRVVLADSNQTQRQLMNDALRRQAGLNVSSCRADASECLAHLADLKTDVLLIAPAVAEDSSHLLDFVRIVRSSVPELPIIVLLNSSERELVVHLLRAGVRGLFCLSSQPFKALRKCIRAVHQGQFWTNTEQMGFLMQALTQTLPASVVDVKGNALLTQRENQVVSLVAEGLSNRAAARQLKITENSIKKTLLRIYDKLGISNRVELVLYAVAQRDAVAAPSAARRSTPVAPAPSPGVKQMNSPSSLPVPEKRDTAVLSSRAS